MTGKIPKTLAAVVALTGFMVMVGWVFDIAAFKSILPQFVTMKLATAICFVLSAVTLYLSAWSGDDLRERDKLALMFVSYLILLVMASLVTSVFLGIKTGFEDLFVREAAGAVRTTVPGRPAISTMIAFVAIAAIGLSRCSLGRRSFPLMRGLGVAVAAIGAVALVGYAVDLPALYYHLGAVSTAMAAHTAALFVLLGAGFISVRRGDKAPSGAKRI